MPGPAKESEVLHQTRLATALPRAWLRQESELLNQTPLVATHPVRPAGSLVTNTPCARLAPEARPRHKERGRFCLFLIPTRRREELGKFLCCALPYWGRLRRSARLSPGWWGEHGTRRALNRTISSSHEHTKRTTKHVNNHNKHNDNFALQEAPPFAPLASPKHHLH